MTTATTKGHVRSTVSSAVDSWKRWWHTSVSLWGEARQHDAVMMQLIVVVACTIISISVGYLYVDQIWVKGWQLWTWITTALVLLVALLPFRSRPAIHLPEWRWLLLLGIFSLMLRILQLESIPGLLHVDELGSADFPMRHVFPQEGLTINPFVTGNASQPVLYQYLMRLSIAVFGYSITGIRITSVLAGTAAVLSTYALIRHFHDRATAFFAAAIMATYHYHVYWSRIALNNIWDTLWVPLMLLFFAWGWHSRWSGGAVLAGLVMGISQYFYAGSKLGVFLLCYVAFMLYRRDPDRSRLIVHGGKLLMTAVVIAAPITLFAAFSPELYFQRTDIVMGWTQDNIVSTIGEYDLWRYLGHQLWRNFGAFTSVTEVTGFYGPEVPFLIGMAAPLFVIGALWVAWKRRFLPVLWILLTVVLGGIMLGGAPSSSHYIVSVPAICWLTAAPLSWLWKKDHRWIALAALAAIILTDSLFYFGIYVPTPPRDLIYSMPPLP